jgi:predicted  nucleic acid-binding Zn-ribbon protein
MSTFLLCQTSLAQRCTVFERYFCATGAKRHAIETIPGWELRLYTDFHGNPPKVIQLAPDTAQSVSKVVLINWQGKDAILSDVNWQTLGQAPKVLKRLRNLCSHILLISPDGVVIHQDEMGTHALYTSFNHTLVSNSFLAVADMIGGRLTQYHHAVYEYLINGSLFGQTTFFNEIKRVAHHHDVHVCRQYARLIPFEAQPNSQPELTGFDQHIGHHKERLLNYFNELAINEQTHLSFSGGYDSRLLLACTQVLGVRPKLFVYGKDTDSDVQIARLITQKEKLDLTVVDKSQHPTSDQIVDGDETLNTFYSFDGWKVEHGLFDGGVDRLDRLRRNAGQQAQQDVEGQLSEHAKTLTSLGEASNAQQALITPLKAQVTQMQSTLTSFEGLTGRLNDLERSSAATLEVAQQQVATNQAVLDQLKAQMATLEDSTRTLQSQLLELKESTAFSSEQSKGDLERRFASLEASISKVNELARQAESAAGRSSQQASALGKQVRVHEQAINAIDGTRRQVNSELLTIRDQLNALSLKLN